MSGALDSMETNLQLDRDDILHKGGFNFNTANSVYKNVLTNFVGSVNGYHHNFAKINLSILA